MFKHTSDFKSLKDVFAEYSKWAKIDNYQFEQLVHQRANGMPQRDRRWVLEKGKVKDEVEYQCDGIKFGQKYYFSEHYGVWDGVYAQIW